MRNGCAPGGCARHKALDVLCFDKDSTVFHCLSLRKLWSQRKTFSSCLESDGLGQNMITQFYSPSLRPSPSFFCLSIFISTPPHSLYFFHSPFFLFHPSSFTIILDHLKILPNGNCFLFASCATDTISFALTSSLVPAHLTQNQYWFGDDWAPGWGGISGASD